MRALEKEPETERKALREAKAEANPWWVREDLSQRYRMMAFFRSRAGGTGETALEYVVRSTDFDEFLVEAVYVHENKLDVALIAVFSTEAAANALARDLNRLKYI